MSLYITLTCDFPACDRIYRSWTFNKSQLLVYARRDGWQIGKAKHYCPSHRSLKRRPSAYSLAYSQQQP